MAKATKTSILTDQKYLGKEPEFDENELSKVQLINTYNWYNYFKDTDAAKSYITDWCNSKKIKINISMHNNNTFGWLARMLARGAVVDEATKIRFDEYIETLRKPAKVISITEPEVEVRQVNRMDAWMPDFEEAVDNFKSPFSCYNYLVSRNVPQVYVKQIAEYYEAIYDEVYAAYNKKDKELADAYKHHSRTDLKALMMMLKKIVDDCGSLLDNVKKERKPRKKREKSADALLKYFKYCKHDSALKISSEAPEKIIGASSIYVFNVKYKTLAVIHAADEKGLTINRTAIDNFDEKTSMIKRVGRKVDEVITAVNTGTKRSRLRIMDSIKTDPINFTNRLNENSLILKVDK